MVSAPNLQPAADAEALARQVFNDGPVILDAVARGNQEFEDRRGIDTKHPADEATPIEEEDPFTLPLPSIMEAEEAPSASVRARPARTDVPDSAEGYERSVRQRRESRAEPDAERLRRRKVSSYDITDDLPQQTRVQFPEARNAQFGDLAGAMSEQQNQRWTTYKVSIANRVLTKEHD